MKPGYFPTTIATGVGFPEGDGKERKGSAVILDMAIKKFNFEKLGTNPTG